MTISNYFRFSGEKGHSSSVRQLATSFNPSSESQQQYLATDNARNDLAGLLRSVAPDSSFIQLHDMKPFPKKAIIPCPDPPLEIAKKLAYPSTSEELEHAMRLTKEQCSAVEAATRQQADSNEWVAQR